MRKTWIALMTAAMVSTAGGAARAQGPPPGGMPPRVVAALGLDDQQQAAWQAAFATMRATAGPLYAQAKAIRTDIEALFDAGNPDPAVLGQKMIALHAVQVQLQQARAAMESARTSVLNEDQKLKLDALKAMRPHHGHHWGGPPPAPPSQ